MLLEIMLLFAESVLVIGELLVLLTDIISNGIVFTFCYWIDMFFPFIDTCFHVNKCCGPEIAYNGYFLKMSILVVFMIAVIVDAVGRLHAANHRIVPAIQHHGVQMAANPPEKRRHVSACMSDN